MFSDETWKWFETYKDFITNGLDLLSFIFATDQLLRIIGPVMGKLPLIIFRTTRAIGVFLLAAFILKKLGASELPSFIAPVISLGLLRLIKVSVDSSTKPAESWMTKAGNVLVPNLFWIGVCLFFLSRIYAFVIAAHELLTVPQ